MPLFDAIESDVTAFFVSQGTVFDSLVKALMDRMAVVESSVALLRTDVTNNFNLVNQRLDAHTVAAADVSAATAAAAVAAASAALAALPTGDYGSPAPPVATVVDPDGGRNEELEYYVMTLSRQLNMVLEVLFQPHGDSNVVEVVQAKQTQLHSISDVLTENEAILMQLAAQHADAHSMLDSGVSEVSEGQEVPVETQESPLDTKGQQPTPKKAPPSDQPYEISGDPKKSRTVSTKSAPEVSTVPGRTEPPEKQVQTPSVQQLETNSLPSVSAEAVRNSSEQQVSLPAAKPQSVESVRRVVETISPHSDTSPQTKEEDVVRTVNSLPDNQSSTPDERGEDDDEERDQMSIDSPPFRSQPPHPDGSLHRRRSFFHSCQDLQRQEEEKLREQRRREEELMRRMHELFLQSRSHIQREHVEEWRQQQDEVTQNQQTLIVHLQGQMQEQLQVQQQREQEWRHQQDEQRIVDLVAIQHEVDRKLETFNSLNATAQATPGHELAQVKTQLIADFDKCFVSPAALEEACALWLKTAADNCIYGANPDTLSNLQRDLLSFKTQLNSHPVKSPAVSALHEAVDRAVHLLLQPTAPSDDVAKGSEQESTMYTLRQLLAKVDSSYRAAAAEHEEFQLPDVGFLSEVIHRMELGTANLLDAVDFQQDNFQQTLVQQQTGLEKLQKELWRQQEVKKALQTQLGACPSKEDTLRLVQDLRDQITATTADSASRMLDTVDDLRYRMAGLPNTQMLEELANDLHAKTDRITHELDTAAVKFTNDLRQKADRAEIDHLQSLLEASTGTKAPPACLTKSPLKCLSCDQHLPFVQAPPEDSAYPEHTCNPGSPTTEQPGSPPRSPSNSPPRHIVYHNHNRQQQPQQLPYSQYPGYSQPAGIYNDLGINMGILEDLFAASTSALERRRQQRHRLEMQLLTPESDYDNDWVSRTPTFLNIDDGRNRIPLRKTQLSDQVIYGPAITPNAFRKKQFGRSDERPKTAALPERRSGGEVITRTTSSTVIVSPFAELTDKRLQKR